MNYQFTIPQSFPQMTVKELLEDYFLIPRKIRHFLRTKKHVLVNGETINWQSPVQKGDQQIILGVIQLCLLNIEDWTVFAQSFFS